MNDYFKSADNVSGEQNVKINHFAHYHNIGIVGGDKFELIVKLKNGTYWYSLGTAIDKSVSDAPFEFTGLLDAIKIVPVSGGVYSYEITGG